MLLRFVHFSGDLVIFCVIEFRIAAGIRMLPSRYSIDYEALLSDAKGYGSANISLVLMERLHQYGAIGM